MSKQRGFTLLELLVTIAIIGSVIAIGSGSGMTDLKQKRTAQNTQKELRDQLATLRNHAMSKNTTGRMAIAQSGSTYTVTLTYSSTPTTTCSSAGTWTTIQTKQIDVHTNYSITGAAFTNSICFYRDGSSSGGSFIIAPNSGATGTTYTLDTSIATGFIDVTES